MQDVLVNGVSVGAVTSYTFAPVGANQTIAASFAINQYTLTLNTVGSGTLTASPSQATYPHGTVVQLTATAAATWNFDFWSGDASGSTNPLSVTMDANKSITANFGQRNYVWNQTGTASWQVATNWTPNRTTPATNDVLVFNNGATAAIVSNVPTQTVGQVVVSNNTNVTLQAAAPVTVTIAGAAGTDLSVAAGSTLQLTGASTIALAIGTGANGQVSGTVNVAGAAHRLTATDASSLVFASGARMTNGASFSGNAFGTTSLNSVVFQAGSIYEHVAGSNPFGATAPSSVVVFQAGSRYRVDGAITASLSGRTYADFEYNNAGTSSLTGASAFTVDSLIVTRGTLNVNLTGGGTVRGSVHVKAAGTLNWTPASGTPTFSFAGTAAQNLDIQGAWTVASNARVDVNNPAGVNLLTNVTLSGPLQFTSGRLVTGARTLSLGTASTVSGAAAGTGWVHGNLLKNLAVGAFTTTLAIGDATRYAPIAVTGSGAGAGFGLNASTVGTDHPNLGLSGLDGTRSANRYWSLTSLNGTGASWSADFQFDAADVDAGVNTAAWAARVWDGSAWSALTTGTTSGTSVQVTGLSAATAGTQYAFGNLPSFTITASAGAGGSISPSGSVSVAPGGNQTFTITPNAGFAIADVLVNGSSVGAVASYTFNSVGANQTIAASFVAVARTLTVNVVGGGSVTKSPDQASYPDGSTVQLTAVAASGHSFAGWSGALTGTTNPANLLMDGDKTVTATFTDVAAPSVTLSAPDGGETISIGTATTITWSASDNVAVTAIDLALSRSGTGGPFETIANGLANTGSYSWTVTGPVSSTARVRVTARDAQGNSAQDVSAGDVSIANTTGVGDGTPVTEVLLAPVVPNPVRGATRFTFALPREASIRLSVHDVQGRERLLLAEGDFAPGRHSLDWSAAGSHVLDPGLYFVRLQVSGRTLTQRFTVVK